MINRLSIDFERKFEKLSPNSNYPSHQKYELQLKEETNHIHKYINKCTIRESRKIVENLFFVFRVNQTCWCERYLEKNLFLDGHFYLCV